MGGRRDTEMMIEMGRELRSCTWPSSLSARLSCEARGEPAPSVFWTREGPDKIFLSDRNGRRRAGRFRCLVQDSEDENGVCDIDDVDWTLVSSDTWSKMKRGWGWCWFDTCVWFLAKDTSFSVNRVDGPILELSKVISFFLFKWDMFASNPSLQNQGPSRTGGVLPLHCQ